LAQRENVLKEQMNSYGEKFKELQETLTKSNEVFTGFKKDSEKMQKRIKSSEKERLIAEKLAQKQSKELADITEKHEALKKDSAGLKKQKERMEMLCRTLTQERSDLKEKLRALGALPGPDLTPGLQQEGEASAADAAAAPQDAAADSPAA
jgi:DNA repair exonuclease SbcCD ATPase subunit